MNMPTTTTRLSPLPDARAREVFEMMGKVQDRPHAALALDDDGRVIGIVGADDTEALHLLGDFNVHA